MQLRWTEAAAVDIQQIADYLCEQLPAYAEDTLLKLYEAPLGLLQFPFRGRIGRKVGTREMVVPSLPYIIVYAVSKETIHVVRILHGAQDYP